MHFDVVPQESEVGMYNEVVDYIYNAVSILLVYTIAVLLFSVYLSAFLFLCLLVNLLLQHEMHIVDST